MQVYKSFRFVMIFAFLCTFLFLYLNPTSVYANANTGSIADCVENPDSCKDDAEPDAEKGEVVSATGDVSAWEYIKMILSLIFVVALFYALMKFLNKKSMNYQHNQMIQNLGGISLGAQKSVQLLQVGNSLYLVGVGEDVQLLREITNVEEVEQLIAQYNERQEMAVSSPYFTELLSKFKKTSQATSTKSEKTPDAFGELFEKKISEIKHKRSEEIEKWKKKENDE